MPRYRVKRATIDSATGRIYQEGEIATIDVPMYVLRDLRGDPVKGAEPKPMAISSNLELIPEDPAAERKGK